MALALSAESAPSRNSANQARPAGMEARAPRYTVFIAIASFVISVISLWTASYTFYFTYFYSGELDFLPPDRVGIAWDGTALRMLIPITLTNTSSARYRAQVYEMAADLSTIPAREGRRQTSFHMPWQTEMTYISTADYFTKYQEWVKSYPDRSPNLDLPDQLSYVGRAFPFQLIGGAFISKFYLFEETGITHPNDEIPIDTAAVLKVSLRTNDKVQKSWSFRLMLPGEIKNYITYVDVLK
jgi:hypothetical protein